MIGLVGGGLLLVCKIRESRAGEFGGLWNSLSVRSKEGRWRCLRREGDGLGATG